MAYKNWRLFTMNNEKGFTLIEMMIVMLIISVLLIITIPNVAKHNTNINTKGCEAFERMVEAQVQAYKMDKGELPSSVDQLKSADYLKNTKCPDGTEVVIGKDGTVTIAGATTQ
jgi:competence protein ComGC